MIDAIFEGLYREDGPPVDLADRISASFPNHFLRLLHQRVTKDIADIDKYVLTLQSRVDIAEDAQGHPRWSP